MNTKNSIKKLLNETNFKSKVLFRQSSWYDEEEVNLDISIIRDLQNKTKKIQVIADMVSEPYREVFFIFYHYY